MKATSAFAPSPISGRLTCTSTSDPGATVPTAGEIDTSIRRLGLDSLSKTCCCAQSGDACGNKIDRGIISGMVLLAFMDEQRKI
eukprot:CAMPEP_0115133504 /NCGR_PEP_ID=MMETSP0227-20121206/54479_1 /TAXON_ID=89957 /ORGANISM="Polarella glacialis, Strain CCMP 1383" /LENGTH=83 /DNA_ID=CAMNT_0002539683 /DNA_START=644 /DNA_END=895 /DNA_ORIENTATION=-